MVICVTDSFLTTSGHIFRGDLYLSVEKLGSISIPRYSSRNSDYKSYQLLKNKIEPFQTFNITHITPLLNVSHKSSISFLINNSAIVILCVRV